MLPAMVPSALASQSLRSVGSNPVSSAAGGAQCLAIPHCRATVAARGRPAKTVIASAE